MILGDNANNGFLSVTNDGGENWESIDPFTSDQPMGLSFPSLDSAEFIGLRAFSTISYYDVRGDMMVMATNLGNYYLSRDKGRNWTKHETPLTGSARSIASIAFFDENTIMVSSNYDRELDLSTETVTFATNDGGATWVPGLPEVVSGALHRVPGTQQSFIMNGHNGFSFGLYGTFITHDLGETWERLDFTRNLAVFINDDDIGIGGCCNNFWDGAEGQIFKWENPLSSIEDENLQFRISLTPNPTTDNLNIHIENPILLKNSTVEIFNNSGQLVYSKKLPDGSGKINLNQLSNGIYFFRLKTVEGIFSSKFVKG